MTAPFVLPDFSKPVLLAKFFRALGDPTRLRILEAVMDKERNVTELVKITDAPQGRVSSHLTCLRWCGYVTARQEGRNVFYRMTDHRVRALIEMASGLVGDNTDRIRTCTVIDRSTARRSGARRVRVRR